MSKPDFFLKTGIRENIFCAFILAKKTHVFSHKLQIKKEVINAIHIVYLYIICYYHVKNGATKKFKGIF